MISLRVRVRASGKSMCLARFVLLLMLRAVKPYGEGENENILSQNISKM